MKNLLVYFAAGCLGAMENSLAVWSFGHYGITTLFGVSMAPSLSPRWLYPRIVWDGYMGTTFHAADVQLKAVAQRYSPQSLSYSHTAIYYLSL